MHADLHYMHLRHQRACLSVLHAPSPLQPQRWNFLRFCVKSHLQVGKTTMYLVSLESYLKMQEDGVGFILEYTVCTCANLTKFERAPLSKHPGPATESPPHAIHVDIVMALCVSVIFAALPDRLIHTGLVLSEGPHEAEQHASQHVNLHPSQDYA